MTLRTGRIQCLRCRVFHQNTQKLYHVKSKVCGEKHIYTLEDFMSILTGTEKYISVIYNQIFGWRCNARQGLSVLTPASKKAVRKIASKKSQRLSLLSSSFSLIWVIPLSLWLFSAACSTKVAPCNGDTTADPEHDCLPLAPGNLDMEDRGDTDGYRVEWEAMEGAEKYEITKLCQTERVKLSDVNWSQGSDESVPENSYMLGVMDPGQVCYMRVRTCNQFGCGRWIKREFIIGLKPPDDLRPRVGDVPLSVDASGNYAITNNIFQILWDGDTDANLTHYIIQERKGASGSWQVPDNGNIPSADASTGDLTRNYGKNYSFRVKSCGREGGVDVCGPWSSVSKLLLRLPPPANFGTSSATSYSGDYSLSWSAGTSSASSVDRYEIEESTDGGSTWGPSARTSSPASPPASPPALEETYAKTIGTYSYRIRSCVGESVVPNVTCSAWNTKLSLVTVDPLPTVTGVVSDEGSGANIVSEDASYEISWDAVAGVSEYEITESIGGVAHDTVKVSQASQSYTGKAYGKAYSYTVKACAGNNCGADVSNLVSVEVRLAAPRVNVITATYSGRYTVDWPNDVTNANSYDWQEASSSSGGSPLASDWSVATSVVAGVSSFEQVGKSAGSIFNYRVRACRDISNTQLDRACGEYSNVRPVIVPSLSGGVTLSNNQNGEGDGEYTLTRADTLSVSTGDVSYELKSWSNDCQDECADVPAEPSDTDASAVAAMPTPTKSFTDDEIQEFQSARHFRVRACTGENCTAWSSVHTVKVLFTKPAITLSDVFLTHPTGRIVGHLVSWANSPSASTHQIERRERAIGTATWSSWSSQDNSSEEAEYKSEDNTASFGYSYEYRVKACETRAGAEYCRSSTVEDRDLALPQVSLSLPAGPFRNVGSDGYIGGTLNWLRKGGGEYQLQEKVGSGSWDVVPLIPTDFTDREKTFASTDKKEAGAVYTYRMRICRPALGTTPQSCGAWSSDVVSDTTTLLPPPNAFGSDEVGSVSYDGEYNLTYTGLSTYHYTPAVYYNIQKKIPSVGTYSVIQENGVAKKFSCASGYDCDVPIVGDSTVGVYEYQIRSCSSVGCGPWSSSAISVELKAIDPVTNHRILTGGTTGEVESGGRYLSRDASYTISWNAVTGVNEYEITESIGGVVQAPVKVSQISQSYTDRVYGKTYSYTVKACSGSNCSVASSSVSVDVRLAAPQNLRTSRATPDDGDYTISWNAVSASAGGYVLEESIDIGNGTNWTAVILVADGATSHDFENREGETNYKYRVRACVITGCTALSSESSPWATSPDDFVRVVYPAITTIALSETTDIDGAYSFTWNKLGNASKYQIRKRFLATPLATERTRDRYKKQRAPGRLRQSGQLGHRSYGYKIRACNSQNICTSNWSREVTVEVTLPAVSGLRSDENTSYDRRYTVSWDNIAPDAGNRYGTNNANITYKLEEQTGPSSAWTSFGNVTLNSYPIIVEKAPSTYSYRVSSCSTVGCGPSTAGSKRVSVDVRGLLAPTQLSSSHNPVYIGSGSGTTLSDGAELTWNSVIGATHYKIETALPASSMFTSPTWRALATQAQSSYSIAPQAASGGHLYRVTACVTASCSANLVSPPSSPSVTIVTHDLTPPALTSDEVTSNDGSYTITWPAVTGATRYVLEESSDAGTTWTPIGNGASPVVPSTKTTSASYSYRLTTHGMRNVSLTGSTLSVAVALNCAIGTGVTWTSTSGSSPNTCEASTTALMALGNTVKLEDTSGAFRGSATFTCTGGALVLASSASAECGTQGTVASYPIIITTYAQLKTVKNGLAKHYRLGNDIDASASWNEGASNCVAYNGSNGKAATCRGFTPIGNSYTNSFTGSFDGAGHKITKLYINRPSINYAGLFGSAGGSAEIKNIGVTEAYIVGKDNVGGLIGALYGFGTTTNVSNSYATGAVMGAWSVGGLIGHVYYGTVSNSYATGAVTGTSVSYVGGLIGYAFGASVSNSYATGAVTEGGGNHVGGLIGRSLGSTVSNSYATGAVTGVSYVGGLIGRSDDTVTGKNYFVDASGGSNGLGSGTCTGTCERKTAADIAALTSSTTGWAISTSGTTGNWNFGTATQLPAVLYNGTSCETISGTNNITSNDGDTSIPDCGDLLPGQPIALGDAPSVPIIISTYAQLKTVKNSLDKHYRLGGDIDASPSRSEGASNCVAYNGSNGKAATCTGFTPIGNGYTNSFTGSFDGAGHKITKLYIKRPSRNQVGLFGYAVNSAEIKNVGVTDAYVEGQSQVGGLIGWSAGFGTSVSNSYATGVVTGTGYNVGGLIGNSSGSVSNSYATGAVTGRNNVGGLIGYAYGASVSVSNSYATGAVTGTGYNVGGLIGGLTGSSSVSVSNSYATGAVRGSSQVGGLIGDSSGTVSNSYATGTVMGNIFVGGLIGRAPGSGSVSGKNYFVDASGGSDGIGSGSCSGTCERKTAADIAALTSTTGWTVSTSGSTGNWDFGTTTQLPAVLYSGGGCETISGTNDINSNDRDASIPDCGDLLPGQPIALGDAPSVPIIISTYAQLKTVKNGLSKHYRLGGDIDASPSWREGGPYNCVAYTGSNGATATCTGFTPIGKDSRNTFTGSFDGAGHKITKLYIKRPSRNQVGLFGYTTKNAEIKNIGVTDAYVVGKKSVGGLIGRSYGSGSSVGNSYATGTVTGENSVGGLIGQADGSVSNSYATGAVTGTGNHVGGLIGYSFSSVSNSYTTGVVRGGSSVGGLIGYFGYGPVVSNSYATGAVTGTGNYVGGLVGGSFSSVTGKNYFVDASGGSDGIGRGTCSGTCERKTAARITALTSTSGWTVNTSGATGNWNFGTATQFPAVLYGGGGCETISGTNNINSNDGDTSKVDCGDLLPGQR